MLIASTAVLLLLYLLCCYIHLSAAVQTNTCAHRSDEEEGEDSQEEDLSHFKLDSLPEDPFGECRPQCDTLIAGRELTPVTADVNPNRAAAKLEEQAKREQMKLDHVKVSHVLLQCRSLFDT